MSNICPEYTWCTDAYPGHLQEHCHGFSFHAVAEESSVHVNVSHVDENAAGDWSVWIDFSEWIIEATSDEEFGTEIDREFANLRSIVDQIETRVRAFHAAHVGAPLKRQADVVERLEALADR